MDEHIHYEELYRNIIGQMELMHKDNLKRLKIGFRCILIVPTIFLLLLLFTKSSKVVFLILWIVSMFIIAAYLIGVEYSDYKLQARISNAADTEGDQTTTLMAESIEENKNAMHDLLMREESRLPFKFGNEQKDEKIDAAEYDTGDFEAFSPDAAATDFDDGASDFGAGGLTADDYDTLPGETGEVLTSDTVSDEAAAEVDSSAVAQVTHNDDGELHVFDIDDDMDDLETLLTQDDLTLPAPDAMQNGIAIPQSIAPQAMEVVPATASEAEHKPQQEAELKSELELDGILSEYHNDYFAPEELNTDVQAVDAGQKPELEDSIL